MAGKPLDEAHLREALSAVEGGDVEAAIKELTPMVGRKRFTRPSGRVAEPLEIEEVTGWLATALEDPDLRRRTVLRRARVLQAPALPVGGTRHRALINPAALSSTWRAWSNATRTERCPSGV